MAFNFNFGIPQLRQNALMEQYDAPQGGYDWTQPMVDYSSGEMPQMQVDMPPPSVGPVQDTPPAGLFGREYTPSMTGAQPTTPQMGAPPPVTPPQVNTYDPDRANRDMMSAIGKVFTPEHIDRDRLRAQMDAAPVRGPIGWGRGLSAIALGIGSKSPEEGLKAQESVLYAPHRRDMADWTAKNDPFLKTAELENRENVNERTLAGNVVKSVSDDRRLEQTRIRDEGKQAVAEKKAENDRIKAMAQEARAHNWTVKVVGPDVMTYPPNGGPGKRLGPSGNMTQEDKINLEGQWDVAAAKETAKGAGERAATSQAREFTDPEGNVWVKKPGSEPEPSGLPKGSVPSSAKTGTGGGELESNRKEQSVMERLWATDEDGAREHITKGTNGKFEWKKRPSVKEDSWFPGDQSVGQEKVDSYDRARKSADPTYVPPKTAAAPPKPTQAAPTPRIRVEAGAPINEPKFPEINVNKPAGSTKGLGPQNVPDATPSGGYKTQTDANNPMNKRRSPDGGRTWEVSHDGGKTWGK